jgi:glyoxylate/hydroxypyruvate reductase
MPVRKKIVISRDIGVKALSLLHELDQAEWEIVLWKENEPASRQWLEQSMPGVTGLLILLTDQVM